MDDGGIFINVSIESVHTQQERPKKRPASPAAGASVKRTRKGLRSVTTDGGDGAGRPHLTSQRRKGSRPVATDGGDGAGRPYLASQRRKGSRPAAADGGNEDAGRPHLTSLFRGNPAVPALDLPTAGTQQPGPAALFSGRHFSDLLVHPRLLANVQRQLEGAEMTRVQQLAVPAVLQGRDCLIRSQTGSGKTLAYALPVVHSLQALEPPVTRESGLYVLVIVPTRELALQTHTCLASLTKAFVRLVPGYLMGGEKTKAEKRRLRRGLNLLVATPGRLLEHISKTKNLSLAHLRWLVIDEADLLLDMGYEKHVRSVMESIQSQRADRRCARLQTLMLSATLDDRVQKLAGLSLDQPVRIDAAAEGDICGAPGELVTPGQLRHHVAIVPAKLRLVTLASFVLWKCSSRSEKKMVVFMNTQDMVDFHCALLQTCLPKAAGQPLKFYKLHGSMTHEERKGVFSEFGGATAGVLLCTDVAARGLDLPRVHWIVQYTPPSRPSDYVHRVGRTARAGGAGSALAFLTPAEAQYVERLSRAGVSVAELSVETVLESLDLPSAGSPEDAATQLQLLMEETLLQDAPLMELARKAYTSFVRAYATYPAEMKPMFSVRNLHLGHYAKALCLRETPTALGRWRTGGPGQHKTSKRAGERSRGVDAPRRVRIPQPTDISEFQHGMDQPAMKKRASGKKIR